MQDLAFHPLDLQFATHDAKDTILYIVYYIEIFCSLLIEGHILVKKKDKVALYKSLK